MIFGYYQNKYVIPKEKKKMCNITLFVFPRKCFWSLIKYLFISGRKYYEISNY